MYKGDVCLSNNSFYIPPTIHSFIHPLSNISIFFSFRYRPPAPVASYFDCLTSGEVGLIVHSIVARHESWSNGTRDSHPPFCRPMCDSHVMQECTCKKRLISLKIADVMRGSSAWCVSFVVASMVGGP